MKSVYAFEWCNCIYESGMSIISLHSTKKGAVKAMVTGANSRWIEDRSMQLMYGKHSSPPLKHEAWRVNSYEVNDES